jgi:hypothetical protein
VDVTEDGTVLQGSIEEYSDRHDPGDYYQLTVMPALEPGGHAWAKLSQLLAEPWSEPELPFPPRGWQEDIDRDRFGIAVHRWSSSPDPVRHLPGVGIQDAQLEF